MEGRAPKTRDRSASSGTIKTFEARLAIRVDSCVADKRRPCCAADDQLLDADSRRLSDRARFGWTSRSIEADRVRAGRACHQ